MKLTLPPIQKSPSWLSDQPCLTNGYSLTSPPTCVLAGRKIGRTSRSMRRMSVHAPKSSTRSFNPKPNVTGQFDTSVKPCW